DLPRCSRPSRGRRRGDPKGAVDHGQAHVVPAGHLLLGGFIDHQPGRRQGLLRRPVRLASGRHAGRRRPDLHHVAAGRRRRGRAVRPPPRPTRAGHPALLVQPRQRRGRRRDRSPFPRPRRHGRRRRLRRVGRRADGDHPGPGRRRVRRLATGQPHRRQRGQRPGLLCLERARRPRPRPRDPVLPRPVWLGDRPTGGGRQGPLLLDHKRRARQRRDDAAAGVGRPGPAPLAALLHRRLDGRRGREDRRTRGTGSRRADGRRQRPHRGGARPAGRRLRRLSGRGRRV
ncbi:MAG: hypothetical protein AVDCRST_MAG73-1557, partial [uncultured Thermomicrobiales bacterium]